MSNGSRIIASVPLGTRWQTLDPFLFCVHHNDAYPAGNSAMGVAPSQLAGRDVGMDFSTRDGWSMYHGDAVPGFPRHPHRGFETVTLARRGYIDHSDSLGAAARFGHGDVQWMTAGGGIVHSEMFPLVNDDEPNPTELFQIWLNLPASDKLVDPHFAMLWAERIPNVRPVDSPGVEIVVIAGALEGERPPTPPPSSWASRSDSEVVIWTIALEPGACWTVPGASPELNRVLYFFNGDALEAGGESVRSGHAIQVDSSSDLLLANGDRPSELLMLQGRPIAEPMVQHGPFVMNDAREINQAIADYRQTEFGGWPWSEDGPVHARSEGRFARRADGAIERPRVGR